MAVSALRSIACAGALATAVLLSGAGAGLALADPDASPSADVDGASTPDNPVDPAGGSSGGGESEPEKEPPSSTVGNGREDVGKKPADEVEKEPAAGFGGWPKFKHSLSIPVLRMPTPEEVTAKGWPDPAMFFGTVDVPVPTIDGFLSSLSQPTPEPTPQPSFRTQQEAPPVLDVTGGGGGGGGMDPMAAESGAPPVFRLPLVVAPAIPIPGISPATPVGAAAAAPPVASSPSAAAGARAPLIRGSVSPRTDAAKSTMTPMSGQATRVGYSRYLSNPTTAQLAAVALPGVAGLMFLTFGGGVIGYRQANSIRFIRTSGAERFLQ